MPPSLFPPNLSGIAPAGFVLCALASAVALGSGCNTNCDGVGCAEEYGATLVGIHLTERVISSGTLSPKRADATISGDRSAGVDWAVDVVDESIWVGMPEVGAVRRYQPRSGDFLLHTESEALLQSANVGDRLGTVVQSIGDVDGDGVLDVAITAPGRSLPPNQREVGAVLLVPVTELESGDTPSDGARVRTLVGPQSGGRMGESIAPCPDMDGDGLPELLIGVPWYDRSTREPLTGAAVLVMSQDFPEPGAAALDTSGVDLWTGPNAGARAGTSVACADVIGDPTPDLIIGAPFADGDHEGEGTVFIVDGGRRLTGELELVAQRALRGGTEDAWLGWSVATGDLDGDGLTELISGAPGHVRAPGPEVSRPQGLTLLWNGVDLPDRARDVPFSRISGQEEGDSLGRTLKVADLDADGHADLLVGAPRRLVDRSYDAGSLYVFLGAEGHATLRPESPPESAHAVWETSEPYYQTGGTVAVGDVDGDGNTDLVLVHRQQPG